VNLGDELFDNVQKLKLVRKPISIQEFFFTLDFYRRFYTTNFNVSLSELIYLVVSLMVFFFVCYEASE